jgi:hypothetical protein
MDSTKPGTLAEVWEEIECHMFAFWLFPGVCSLNANFSEHSVRSIFIGE